MEEKVFNDKYFKSYLQESGFDECGDSINDCLKKVSNITVGHVLAAHSLGTFNDLDILQWIHKGRKITPLIEEQFVLYRKLAKYLINCVKPEEVEDWKELLNDSKYVWPKEGKEGWASVFGEVPDLCQKIIVDQIYEKKSLCDQVSEKMKKKMSNIAERNISEKIGDSKIIANNGAHQQIKNINSENITQALEEIPPHKQDRVYIVDKTSEEIEIKKNNISKEESSSKMGIDHFNKGYFQELLRIACDNRNVHKSKNVGTALALISGANKIKSRYTKIVKFLGKLEGVTPTVEKQFLMYNNLFEYLMTEVPSTDVSYWKQLLIENEYIEPPENNDLWSNIFGDNVINIKGIYMSEEGKILKHDVEVDTNDSEGFEDNFLSEFFSDDDQEDIENKKEDIEDKDEKILNAEELNYEKDVDSEKEEDVDSEKEENIVSDISRLTSKPLKEKSTLASNDLQYNETVPLTTIKNDKPEQKLSKPAVEKEIMIKEIIEKRRKFEELFKQYSKPVVEKEIEKKGKIFNKVVLIGDFADYIVNNLQMPNVFGIDENIKFDITQLFHNKKLAEFLNQKPKDTLFIFLIKYASFSQESSSLLLPCNNRTIPVTWLKINNDINQMSHYIDQMSNLEKAENYLKGFQARLTGLSSVAVFIPLCPQIYFDSPQSKKFDIQAFEKRLLTLPMERHCPLLIQSGGGGNTTNTYLKSFASCWMNLVKNILKKTDISSSVFENYEKYSQFIYSPLIDVTATISLDKKLHDTWDACIKTFIRQNLLENEEREGNLQDFGNTFKIFVGNLSDQTMGGHLRSLFEDYGTVVEADVINNLNKANYGFVHMQKEEERIVAIAALNGHKLHGRNIVVQASTNNRKGGNKRTPNFIGVSNLAVPTPTTGNSSQSALSTPQAPRVIPPNVPTITHVSALQPQWPHGPISDQYFFYMPETNYISPASVPLGLAAPSVPPSGISPSIDYILGTSVIPPVIFPPGIAVPGDPLPGIPHPIVTLPEFQPVSPADINLTATVSQCTTNTGPKVLCKHCLCEFQQENKKSIVCQKCAESIKKYGPPISCSQCKIKCAFNKPGTTDKSKVLCLVCISGPMVLCMYCCCGIQQKNKKTSICQKCTKSIKKYGAPIPCSQCKLQRAFNKPGTDMSRVLCLMCISGPVPVMNPSSTSKGNSHPDLENKIILSNLPSVLENDDLYKILSACGKLHKFERMLASGLCTVQYCDVESTLRCERLLNNYFILNKKIEVSISNFKDTITQQVRENVNQALDNVAAFVIKRNIQVIEKEAQKRTAEGIENLTAKVAKAKLKFALANKEGKFKKTQPDKEEIKFAQKTISKSHDRKCEIVHNERHNTSGSRHSDKRRTRSRSKSPIKKYRRHDSQSPDRRCRRSRSRDSSRSRSIARQYRNSRSRSTDRKCRSRSRGSADRKNRSSRSRSTDRIYRSRSRGSADRKNRSSRSRSTDRKYRRSRSRGHSGRKNRRSRSRSKHRNDKRSRSRENLQEDPFKLSVEGACQFLMSFCDKIGFLGYSLKEALEKTQKCGNDSRKILETLSNPESQRVLSLIIDEFKILREGTEDSILLSKYIQASIATNFLLETIKFHMETSKLLGLDNLPRHDSSSLPTCLHRSEGTQEINVRPKIHKGFENDLSSNSTLKVPSASELLNEIGDSLDLNTDLKYDQNSTIEWRPDETNKIFQNAGQLSTNRELPLYDKNRRNTQSNSQNYESSSSNIVIDYCHGSSVAESFSASESSQRTGSNQLTSEELMMLQKDSIIDYCHRSNVAETFSISGNSQRTGFNQLTSEEMMLQKEDIIDYYHRSSFDDAFSVNRNYQRTGSNQLTSEEIMMLQK